MGEVLGDRAETLIWGLSELMVGPPTPTYAGMDSSQIARPWGSVLGSFRLPPRHYSSHGRS